MASFIAESIESVIAQNIGFGNIQLILVDNGSTDSTGAVIDRYAKRYPENVVAVHRDNCDVSAAKNAGVDLAVGKYVNFLNAGDLWDRHVFSRVFSFFEKHCNETDVVACPLYKFSETANKKVPRFLSQKFKHGSRIISLAEEPQIILTKYSRVFIKRDAITHPFFEPGMPIAEDSLAIQSLLLDLQTFGVVSDCPYWHRRRDRFAGQTLSSSRMFWLDRLECFHQKIFQRSLKKLQYIPEFIQYAVCNDLLVLLQKKRIPPEVNFGPGDVEKFNRLLHELFREIDDKIILHISHPGTSIALRFYALHLKYGIPPVLVPCDNDFLISFPGSDDDSKLFSDLPCLLDFLTIQDNICTLEGRFQCPIGLPYDEVGISVDANGIGYDARMTVCQDNINYVSLGNSILRQCIFHVEIPIDPHCQTTDLVVFLQVRGVKIALQQQLYPQKFFPLMGKYVNEFSLIEGMKCTLSEHGIRLERRYSAFWDELRFMKELWQKKRKGARKAVVTRMVYHLLVLFKRKPLWLCNDRPDKADDNGEVFFEYLRKNHPEIDSYFVLNRNSPDWDRLKKIGPVVGMCSWKHKMLRLLADCRIGSHPDDHAGDMLRRYHCYNDILNKNKIFFLKHGIIKDDLSSLLCKCKQNLSGFVTAAPREQQSILEGNYGYSEKEVWLTGLPRYDRLYNDPKKKIAIMPTWRASLCVVIDRDAGLRGVGPNFHDSGYRKFYHALLNHDRLLKCAEQYGYQILFLPHQLMQNGVAEFGAPPSVQVYGLDRKVRYREIFAESDLIVTDYSSVVFDFACLRKPVIYAQFDKDEFFSGNHSYVQGYFDYERDGFGEVEYDLESTVDRIVEYMKNGCRLKDKYRDRIDRFFKFHDHNNCRRVFEKIINAK